MMTIRTLLLTPWMTPYRVISYERAIVLSFLGKVEVVEEYDELVRAPSLTIRAPAVVRQCRGRKAGKVRVTFSRLNVFVRDGFTCQYCRSTLDPRALNLDHVMPRSRGGATSWENVVTSCYPCNQRKAGRTPEEASMALMKRPVRPASLPDRPRLRAGIGEIPEAWRAYC
jgi:5-methylcytosine-specific restriction endonuclease McrA